MNDDYLTLIKKVLTDTLFTKEPNPDDLSGATYVREFVQHYMRGRAVTMLPMARLNNVQVCVADVLKNEVPGDLIETGVWRGGCTIFMRAMLKAYGVTDRTVWVADSFAGLPDPDPTKYPVEAKAHAGQIMTKEYKHFAVSLEDVKENFRCFGLLDSQVEWLVGWFKDTLGTSRIQRLAVMRLDGDYFESTMDALVNLYPKLSPGGYVIVDDYGEDVWTYCRRAVDEFRVSQNIQEPMHQVDSKCFYWQRRRT